MSSLKIENVSYAYLKNHFVLHDLTLDLNSNKIYTLLGLNGSGKTTLIKVLAGLLEPQKGIVKLNGTNIKKVSYLERSKYISYVRQGSDTGDDHYVRDYLSFGLINQLNWYQSPNLAQKELVKAKAIRFNIEHLLDKKMNELSGGQKQIVMICRAFIQNAEIIILDEPTSALDFINQSLVLKLLKEIVAEEQKTIILSTHNPNHALFLNSYVVLIDEGKIIEVGPAKEIVSVEKLRKVYGNSISNSKDQTYDEVTFM
mgnify:CR=1 FL=1